VKAVYVQRKAATPEVPPFVLGNSEAFPWACPSNTFLN